MFLHIFLKWASGANIWPHSAVFKFVVFSWIHWYHTNFFSDAGSPSGVALSVRKSGVGKSCPTWPAEINWIRGTFGNGQPGSSSMSFCGIRTGCPAIPSSQMIWAKSKSPTTRQLLVCVLRWQFKLTCNSLGGNTCINYGTYRFNKSMLVHVFFPVIASVYMYICYCNSNSETFVATFFTSSVCIMLIGNC